MMTLTTIIHDALKYYTCYKLLYSTDPLHIKAKGLSVINYDNNYVVQQYFSNNYNFYHVKSYNENNITLSLSSRYC